VVFSVKDKAGALYEMLKPFADNGISLTKIESRPSRQKAWEYHFFVDFEGHRLENKCAEALEIVYISESARLLSAGDVNILTSRN
jgi:chorismate mutase/prephenate dehydratase